MPTKEELDRGFKVGDWEILPTRGVFRCGDQEERPEPKVFGVLMSLAMRDGDLVTRDELIDEHWDGRPTGDEPVNRCLSQLRGHFGDKERPHQYIETLTRRGYRLMQNVQLLDPLHVDEADTAPAPAAKRPRVTAMVVAVLTIIAAIFLAYSFLPSSDVDRNTMRSIAVLPFGNLSGNEGDQYLVSGFKEELIQTLHRIPEFLVKNGRIDYAKELAEVARILDVDAVLSGAVQRSGSMLKITYQLADGRTGLNISSGSISGQVEDIFSLQEKLAREVSDDLLGDTRQQLVSSSRPESFKAYDSYLRGLYALEHRGDPGNLEEAIDLFQRTIELDGNFGPAYLMLANTYVLLPDYRNAPLEESQQLAIEAVQRGIAVDASISDTADTIFGLIYHKQKQWAKSEQAFLRATNASVVDTNAFNWYSRLLASVGRLDAALEQILAALEIDPASAVINSRVAMAYTWMGDNEKATEFFERANKLRAGGSTHLLAYSLLLVREGRIEEARDLANSAVMVAGADNSWVVPVFTAFGDAAFRDEALAATDQATDAGQLAPQVEITIRALLGDLDRAMSVARLLEQPGEAFEMDLLFIPEFLPLRQHPEFPDLMQSLGVTDYWEQMGCIWAASEVRCPATIP